MNVSVLGRTRAFALATAVFPPFAAAQAGSVQTLVRAGDVLPNGQEVDSIATHGVANDGRWGAVVATTAGTDPVGSVILGWGGATDFSNAGLLFQATIGFGGAIGRYVDQIGNSGERGAILTEIDLAAMPQPTGSFSAVAGQNWGFQLWHRDAGAGGAPTSNFTDARYVPLR